jgi:hypothetical protein
LVSHHEPCASGAEHGATGLSAGPTGSQSYFGQSPFWYFPVLPFGNGNGKVYPVPLCVGSM